MNVRVTRPELSITEVVSESYQAKAQADIARTKAETARAGAETAETNAAISETNAAGSASAAATSETNAANSATQAGASASAASGSASTAASEATDAAQSATAAQTAQTAAETARAGAETAETNAATSETNAAGSAAAASSSATVAASAEAQSADTAAMLLPSDFASGKTYWRELNATLADNGTPGGSIVTLPEGEALRLTNGKTKLAPRGYLLNDTSKTYRITVRHRLAVAHSQGGGLARLTMGFVYYRADGTRIGSWQQMSYHEDIPQSADFVDYSFDAVPVSPVSGEAPAYFKPFTEIGMYTNQWTPGDGTTEVLGLGIRDVTSEVAAGASATAASGSASTAASEATDAAQSATAAQTAQTAAETARAGAETAETNAATSETNAAGSASAAATSETNAANSATQAGASASAASGSASTAASEATDAAQSATAAQTAQTAAETARAGAETAETNAATSETNAAGSAAAASSSATVAADTRGAVIALHGNPDFEFGKDGWRTATGWSASYPSGNSAGALLNAGFSASQSLRFTGTGTIHTARYIPVDTSKTYRMKIRVRCPSTSSAPSRVYAGVATYDENYAHQSQPNPGTNRYGVLGNVLIPNDDQWYEYEGLFEGEEDDANSFRPGTKFVTPMILGNYLQDNTHLLDIDYISFDDVTSEVAALTSANAAATSASNAAASETAAGSSATAAANSATNAATSASNASTSASNAAISETNAAGSASAAATSETNAANSATQAGASASAASGSASTAASEATDAAQSATAAQTAQTAAETARAGAETAEGQAATSASNAAGSEAQAASFASIAATAGQEALDHSSGNLVADGIFADNWADYWTGDGSCTIAAYDHSSTVPAADISLEITGGGYARYNLPLSMQTGLKGRTLRFSGTRRVSGTSYKIGIRWATIDTNAYLRMQVVTLSATADVWDVFERDFTLTDNANEKATSIVFQAVQGATDVSYLTDFRVEDVTESEAAGAAATAAAGSAATAQASETAAGSHAAAAQSAQASAETAEANAIAAEASAVTSETNAAGHAATAQSSETVAVAAAGAAGSRNLVIFNNYQSTGVEGWTNAAGTSTNVPPGSPSGALSLEVNDGARQDTPVYFGDINGRKIRVRGWLDATNCTSAALKLVLRGGSGEGSGGLIAWTWLSGVNSIPALTGWTYVDAIFQVNQVTEYWAPAIDHGGGGDIGRVYDLFYEDVTESEAAAASATASASSAAIATTKADEAGVSAAAASASQVAAGTSESNAAASESASAGYASTAQGHSLAAQTSSEVAARFVSGAAVPNATFTDWDGTWPDGFQVGNDEGTISKNTADAKYVNAVEMETIAVPTQNRPFIYATATGNSGTWVLTDKLKVTVELELLAGGWGGVALLGAWNAPTWNEKRYYIDHLLTDDIGKIQRVEVILEAPASVNMANVVNIHCNLYAALLGGAPAVEYKKFLVHSFNVDPVTAESLAAITKDVRADLDGIQAAAIGMRAVAGSAGASLELVALDDPEGGPVSAARISADNIIADGTLRSRHLVIDEALDMDEAAAAFRMGKQSAVDFVNDGIYLGRTDEGGGALGFGFHAGRVSGGVEEYIQHTKAGGLKIKNATFLIGAGLATDTAITTSQTVSLVGEDTVSFSFVAGGGGGGGGAGNGITPTNGSAGQNTVVVLKDGTTTIQTWTATGGTGGIAGGAANASRPSANPSNQSPMGDGGQGGLGQGLYNTSYFKAGTSGAAGATVQVTTLDLTAYADPKLEVTIGSGGAGGTGYSTGGDAGGNGQLVYTLSSAADIPAAPVGITPSATGTFVVTAGVPGSFPVLTPTRGLWVLNNCPTNWKVTPGAGNAAMWVHHGTVSFISPGTPTWNNVATSTKEVRYHFFPM